MDTGRRTPATPHINTTTSGSTRTTTPTSTSPAWSQARFSVTLPPTRGAHDRARSVTNAITNGLAPLLSGVSAGVGLLQLLNSTASLSVGPASTASTTLPPAAAAAATAAVDSGALDEPMRKTAAAEHFLPRRNNNGNPNDRRERPRGDNNNISSTRKTTSSPIVEPVIASRAVEDASVPAAAAETTTTATSAVALELRDGKAVWGAGQELWLTVAGVQFPPPQGKPRHEEKENEAAGRGGLRSSVKHDSSGDPRGGSARFDPSRGSARFDFLVVWSTVVAAAVSGQEYLDSAAPIATTPSCNRYSNGTEYGNSNGTGEGNSSSYSDGDSRSSSSHGTGEVTRVGSPAAAAVVAAGEGDAGPGLGLLGDASRGLGPAGGHVVGELRPLHDFSAERQAALDEVQ